MRVLLLTPYSPLLRHDHAANDIALPLVHALASVVDLHVYSPGQRNGHLDSWRVGGVTYHAGAEVDGRLRQLKRLGLYPLSARHGWSRRSTREALAVARRVSPDVLHADYVQAAEALLRSPKSIPTSITFHDLPDPSPGRRWGGSRLRQVLARLERLKSDRLILAVLDNVDGVFVRSQRDKDRIPRTWGIVEIAPVGLNPPLAGWLGDRHQTASFGGAMWRRENEVTAVHLAKDVMPIVRRREQDAQLRVFGARPTEAVCELATGPGVSVVGEVADYDDEFRRAALTFAPTMVGAGLLMKAIRAMSMGCPVVLNSASAAPIVGLANGVHALVGDTADELATHALQLMNDRARAREIGEAGMRLVREQFSWERTAEVYRDTFSRLLGSDHSARRAPLRD